VDYDLLEQWGVGLENVVRAVRDLVVVRGLDGFGAGALVFYEDHLFEVGVVGEAFFRELRDVFEPFYRVHLVYAHLLDGFEQRRGVNVADGPAV
jgi:hypothetical protein